MHSRGTGRAHLLIVRFSVGACFPVGETYRHCRLLRKEGGCVKNILSRSIAAPASDRRNSLVF